jgi:transcriptional regulator with XRE-family HTH domain
VSTAETIGHRLRRLRREQGLSQHDLAGPGVSGSYVSLIEAGKRQPTAKAVSWLAQRLGTTSAFLLSGQGLSDDRLELGHAELELANGDPAAAAIRFATLGSSSDASISARAGWGLAESREAAGDLEGAIEAYEVLREASLGEPKLHPFVRACLALSRCYRECGDLGRATDLGEQGLEAVSRYGLQDSDLEVNLLCTVAFAYQERGDLVRTTQLLVRVRRQAEALGTPRARGAAYWNASVLASELGETGDAVDLAYRALALFGEGDDTRNIARLRNAYAALLIRHAPDRAAEALELLEQARSVLLTAGSQVDIAYCETELSRALTLVERPDQAQEMAVSALDRLGDDARLESARARQALAYALRADGRTADATREYLTAARALDRLGARRQSAAAWAEVAEHLRECGDEQGSWDATVRLMQAVAVGVAFPAPRVPARSRRTAS